MALFAKLWTDILSDPKLLRAARKGAKHLHLLPWLIAFAKLADDNGRLSVNGEPAEPEDIADGIPCVTPRQVAQCIAELEQLGILVLSEGDDVVRFATWEQRNRAKKSDSAEAIRDRVAKHRKRKRDGDDGSGNALQGGVTKTTEQEIEQEKEKEREQRRTHARNAALQEIRNAPRYRVLAAACTPDELGDVESFLLSRSTDKRRLWIASIADDLEARIAGGPDLAGACRDALVAEPQITGPSGLRAFVARKRSELEARKAAAPPARLPTTEQRKEADQRHDEDQKLLFRDQRRYEEELGRAAADWKIAHPEEAKALEAKHAKNPGGEIGRLAAVNREIARILDFATFNKWRTVRVEGDVKAGRPMQAVSGE